ncbi:MAG: hypothetical protein BGN88_09845 [Clostridiales bacterium 43-6]|nr:MAG: hypothetical protein BGN88_09845 [Clostridiales bacterium 43-6]
MKIAIAQFVICNDIDSNFEKMKYCIENAHKEKADLIAFPECCLTGYLGISLKSLETLDNRKIFTCIQSISKMAKENKIMIVTGQYIKRCGDWYNNLLFFNKEGICAGSYDKTHLIDDDCFHVKPGKSPSIFDVNGVKYLLGICHDIRYPEHAMWGGVNGSQIYINSFNGIRNSIDCSSVQHVYDSMLITRAIENGMYIIAPNVANNEQMVRSQIRNPQGQAIVYAENKDECIIICEIDTSLAGKGWVKRRRSDLYKFETNIINQSYFENSYWQKEYYMIEHSEKLLNKDTVKLFNK